MSVHASCLPRLEGAFSTLYPKEQRLAQYILSQPERVLGMHIADLVVQADEHLEKTRKIITRLHI